MMGTRQCDIEVAGTYQPGVDGDATDKRIAYRGADPEQLGQADWCLVRGRITAPRRAVDTLVTLSSRRPLRTNTRYQTDSRSLYHWVGSGLCGLASGATE